MKYLNMVLLLLIVACTPTSERAPSSHNLIIAEGKAGNTPYWILRPEGEFFVPLPVVYFLSGERGHLFFRELDGIQAMKDYLDQGGTPFVIVGLAEAQDKIISEIEAEFSIGGDHNRLVAGIAQGATLAQQLALTTDLFKCVALHSPTAPDERLRVKFDKKILEETQQEANWKEKLPSYIKWYGECFL